MWLSSTYWKSITVSQTVDIFSRVAYGLWHTYIVCYIVYATDFVSIIIIIIIVVIIITMIVMQYIVLLSNKHKVVLIWKTHQTTNKQDNNETIIIIHFSFFFFFCIYSYAIKYIMMMITETEKCMKNRMIVFFVPFATL